MEWLFLLLPVAAFSGWWVARRAQETPQRPAGSSGGELVRGLNFLLNEQADKAIELFRTLADEDRENIEIQLALGSLFRRRGEVEQAIRVHQALASRAELSREQRGAALYELAQDYLRAGLLDRAETIFRELDGLDLHRELALRGLIGIFQSERDWAGCLEAARRLQSISDESLSTEIAQYHCELAELALSEADEARARAHLDSAERADGCCMRASLLRIRLAATKGDREGALDLVQTIAGQPSPHAPVVLESLFDLVLELGGEGLLDNLERVYRSCPSPQLLLRFADEVELRQGPEPARRLLRDYLAEHAELKSLERLLSLSPSSDPDLERAGAVLRLLGERQSPYRCDTCGFEARTLFWQCPSCRSWGKVVPVQPPRLSGPKAEFHGVGGGS